MVKVRYKGQIHDIPKGSKLPDLEDQIPIPYACYVGACQTCACKVKSGGEFISGINENEEMMGAEGNKRLACQIEFNESAPVDAIVELEAGWEENSEKPIVQNSDDNSNNADADPKSV